VTDNSSDCLLVGNCGKLSILAYESFMGTDDPAFELLDRGCVMTYWVRVIPTPRQAAVLLEEHGGLTEEERGNPHRLEARQAEVGTGDHLLREGKAMHKNQRVADMAIDVLRGLMSTKSANQY
jgi:hypothetical protein